MLLYNQTKNHLRWTIGMTTYTCDPWGSLEVPNMFVEHCKVRGLPLDVAPVAPEVKAQTGLTEATAKAAADEVLALRIEVDLAKAAEASAKGELERVKSELSEATTEITRLKVSLAEQKRIAEVTNGDKVAAEKLLEETAKKLVEAERRAELNAATEEAKGPKKGK